MDGWVESGSERGRRKIEEMEEQEMNGVMVLRPSWPKAFMIDDMLFSSYLLCYVRPSTVEMCLVTTPGHYR